MACDIRICVNNAKLGQTEINVGILPGAGGTQRLARLVGLGKAKELIFTGKIITAEEAARIGLVNTLVEPTGLMDCALAMARDICTKSPFTLRVAKLVVDNGYNADIATALALERLGQTAVFATEDHLEGICAFLEKRDPAYKGR
jgi:enoyl-CoA hydratase